MTYEEATFIERAMDSSGYECEVLPHYSGRGMGEKETYGVVIDDDATVIITSALVYAKSFPEEVPNEFSNSEGYRRENTGRGIVLY
jgi:hypothetical protein